MNILNKKWRYGKSLRTERDTLRDVFKGRADVSVPDFGLDKTYAPEDRGIFIGGKRVENANAGATPKGARPEPGKVYSPDEVWDDGSIKTGGNRSEEIRPTVMMRNPRQGADIDTTPTDARSAQILNRNRNTRSNSRFGSDGNPLLTPRNDNPTGAGLHEKGMAMLFPKTYSEENQKKLADRNEEMRYSFKSPLLRRRADKQEANDRADRIRQEGRNERMTLAELTGRQSQATEEAEHKRALELQRLKNEGRDAEDTKIIKTRRIKGKGEDKVIEDQVEAYRNGEQLNTATGEPWTDDEITEAKANSSIQEAQEYFDGKHKSNDDYKGWDSTTRKNIDDKIRELFLQIDPGAKPATQVQLDKIRGMMEAGTPLASIINQLRNAEA